LVVAAPLWWGPGYGPYGYGYDYGYRAATVVVEREPAVYVERRAPVNAATAPAPASLWFYCTDPAGYYPYVQHCNRTWVEVDPSTVAVPAGR
jgi:hypothetical protein